MLAHSDDQMPGAEARPLVRHDLAAATLSVIERLQHCGTTCRSLKDARQFLELALTSAVELTGADGGCLSVTDPDGTPLHSVVARGGASAAASPDTVCAALLEFPAHETVERMVVVEDTRATPGKDHALMAMLAAADVVAVQSLPLRSSAGSRLGTLLTYRSHAGRPLDEESRALRLIGHYTAAFVETLRSGDDLREMLAHERRARQASDALARRKDEFLATLSHELRQPLSAAVSALALQKLGLSPERRDRSIQIVGRQLQHLGRLVDDLRDAALMDRGVVALRLEHLDLRTVIGEAMDMVRAKAEVKRQRLTADLGTRPAWVLADGVRMTQVFSNLLHNPSAYTPEGGRIEVTLDVEDGQVRVRLRDDGLGILPEAMERIFEPFARGPLSPEPLSLGVGLTVVRQVTTLHGGTVTVTSDGPNRGSEFTVTLPAHAADRPRVE